MNKRQIRDVRKRKTYYFWYAFNRFLMQNPTKEDIIKYMYTQLDNKNAYGTYTQAAYNRGSIVQIFKDTGVCKECEGILKCTLMDGLECKKMGWTDENWKRPI